MLVEGLGFRVNAVYVIPSNLTDRCPFAEAVSGLVFTRPVVVAAPKLEPSLRNTGFGFRLSGVPVGALSVRLQADHLDIWGHCGRRRSRFCGYRRMVDWT